MEIKKLILIFSATVLSAVISAQQLLVTGLITDNRGVPIVGPTVCQINTSNCTTADRNGTFNLLLQENKELKLKVECLGFNPVDVVLDETTVYPLKITLTPMLYVTDETAGDYISYGNRRTTLQSGLNLDAMFTDFSQFSTSLGSYNTELMNYFAVTGPEMGFCISRFCTGFGIGMGYSYHDDYDSLIIDLNATSYYINLGYDIVSSSRLRISPLASFRWLRFRILNYPADRRITLTQYLTERDLDLRFNQLVAVTGLNLEYLMYSGMHNTGDYWSVGLFGGYAIKLHRKPLVYSRGNRLTTENEIGIRHFTFGISLTFYSSARQ